MQPADDAGLELRLWLAARVRPALALVSQNVPEAPELGAVMLMVATPSPLSVVEQVVPSQSSDAFPLICVWGSVLGEGIPTFGPAKAKTFVTVSNAVRVT